MKDIKIVKCYRLIINEFLVAIKLEDTSEDVLKLLNSFGCKFPVVLKSEAQPFSFRVKTRPEEGSLYRCSVSTFES